MGEGSEDGGESFGSELLYCSGQHRPLEEFICTGRQVRDHVVEHLASEMLDEPWADLMVIVRAGVPGQGCSAGLEYRCAVLGRSELEEVGANPELGVFRWFCVERPLYDLFEVRAALL